ERALLRLAVPATVDFGASYDVTGRAASIPHGGFGDWLASLGVTVDLVADDVRPARPPPAWHAAPTWRRGPVSAAAHARLDAAPASLLTGLVTGDVRGQPEEVEAHMLAAGLSHLVAVSGSNVAVVVAGVMGVVLLVGAGRRLAWWVSLATVWW